jgi:hypothetical protein
MPNEQNTLRFDGIAWLAADRWPAHSGRNETQKHLPPRVGLLVIHANLYHAMDIQLLGKYV